MLGTALGGCWDAAARTRALLHGGHIPLGETNTNSKPRDSPSLPLWDCSMTWRVMGGEGAEGTGGGQEKLD